MDRASSESLARLLSRTTYAEAVGRLEKTAAAARERPKTADRSLAADMAVGGGLGALIGGGREWFRGKDRRAVGRGALRWGATGAALGALPYAVERYRGTGPNATAPKTPEQLAREWNDYSAVGKAVTAVTNPSRVPRGENPVWDALRRPRLQDFFLKHGPPFVPEASWRAGVHGTAALGQAAGTASMANTIGRTIVDARLDPATRMVAGIKAMSEADRAKYPGFNEAVQKFLSRYDSRGKPWFMDMRSALGNVKKDVLGPINELPRAEAALKEHDLRIDEAKKSLAALSNTEAMEQEIAANKLKIRAPLITTEARNKLLKLREALAANLAAPNGPAAAAAALEAQNQKRTSRNIVNKVDQILGRPAPSGAFPGGGTKLERAGASFTAGDRQKSRDTVAARNIALEREIENARAAVGPARTAMENLLAERAALAERVMVGHGYREARMLGELAHPHRGFGLGVERNPAGRFGKGLRVFNKGLLWPFW